MGYIFTFNDARHYEHWLSQKVNRETIALQHRLMLDMLQPMRGETLLDIGCGTGSSIRPFLDAGLQVTGIDPSPYMLDMAIEKLGDRVDLYRGFSEDLPFDDNSFNHASLVTTLEFVENPQKAMEEAFRIAKDRVFLGVLNRYAINGLQHWIRGFFSDSIYKQARFFGVWELKQKIRHMLGTAPVNWRTVCQLPTTEGGFNRSLERIGLMQRCPFGSFLGMVVVLMPRFRTKPLTMRYRPKQTHSAATG